MQATGFLPVSFSNVSVRSLVAIDVFFPQMTSTMGLKWAGMVQCVLIDLAGHLISDAISVILMEEVFEATTTSSLHSSPHRLNTSLLVSISSGTASVM